MTEPQDPYAAPDLTKHTPPADPAPPPGYGPPPPGYGPPPPGYGAPPPGWGAPPPPGWAPYPAPQLRTNAMAVVSLVTAFLCTPLGLVFGLIALSQIKRTGEGGRGLAIAGIVVSGISIVFMIIAFALLGVAFSHADVHTCSITPGTTGTC